MLAKKRVMVVENQIFDKHVAIPRDHWPWEQV